MSDKHGQDELRKQSQQPASRKLFEGAGRTCTAVAAAYAGKKAADTSA